MQTAYDFREYKTVTKEELQTALAGTFLLLGGAGVKLYDFWRRTKADAQSDRSDAWWRNEVDLKSSEVERLKVRLEEVSAERNMAVQRLGGLEAHVEHLSEQVEALQAENRELKAMVQSMAVTNKQILEKLEGKD